MEITKYKFQIHGDSRGDLVAIQSMKEIPFEIKRVYYMYNTQVGFHRGKHAHKNMKQVVICIHGACKIMLDDGFEKKVIEMKQEDEGLYIEGIVWRELYDFTPDCVIMVLASGYYDEQDYIRDYDEFLKIVHNCEK